MNTKIKTALSLAVLTLSLACTPDTDPPATGADLAMEGGTLCTVADDNGGTKYREILSFRNLGDAGEYEITIRRAWEGPAGHEYQTTILRGRAEVGEQVRTMEGYDLPGMALSRLTVEIGGDLLADPSIPISDCVQF